MNNYKKSVLLLLKRLLYALVAYSILRVLFVLFNWNSFNNFGLKAFIGGLRFDLSVLFYTNSLLILAHTIPGHFKYGKTYQRVVKQVFYSINTFFLLTNFVDFVYYKFTGRRSTFSLITANGMEQEVISLIPSFLSKYWYVFLIGIIFALLFYKYVPRAKFYTPYQPLTVVNNLKQVGLFLVFTGLILIIGRGGLQRKPLRRVDAVNYAIANNTPIVLNTPFCVFKTINRKKELKLLNFYDTKTLKSFYSPIKHYKDSVAFNKKNVVIIILESFGDENVSFSNPETGNTPFLDSLITKSVYFKNGFANGRVSAAALPSVISGIPSIVGENYVSSSYAFNTIESLPILLKKEGYYTSFFHGAYNGSQNFDQFSNIAGFDTYYGKDQYPNDGDYDGKWGIFDEEFLQFFNAELSTFKEPFLSSVFTISSHIPFIIPEKYKGKFKKGHTMFYETVGYTDFALQHFFNEAKKQAWYKNTLFVITADHCSIVEKGSYKSILNQYTIPILFFDPENPNFKGVEVANFQQIDILPSVLDYLHYDKPFVSYGKSFNEDQHIVLNYINKIYHAIIDDYYTLFDGNKIIELYDFKMDITFKNNLIDDNPTLVKNLENQLKPYLQSFNNNLINNTLTLDKQ